MTSKELKEKYLSFFKKQGHKVIPSASLIPENDPSVLFTTAGMHPLVPYLLGEKHPEGKRLVNVQKCIRTGDIDEVGDGWHLTFFEMLGNWSLGDYFKKEAIEMSFKFLTEELTIPIEKLAVSCFKGDKASGIVQDAEAADVWKKLGVLEERIAFLNKEENWWPAGGKLPGPQGPDTEMFYWTGESPAPKEFNPDDKKWVEIWNDVFMQYNRTEDGQYEELNQKNVDTGMGLERTVAVLDGKQSVYEVEPLSVIVSQVEALIDLPKNDIEQEKDELKAVRIIADHLRAACFILAEGIEPSNVEQGYVLRRLIRRAIRYGREMGINVVFTHRIAEVVIEEMGGYYTELREQKDFIIEQLTREEEKFGKTLNRGLREFEKLKVGDMVSGAQAFKLFATYGFPIEMTRELAQEKKIKVDENGFKKEMKKHQVVSKKGSEKKFKGGLADNSQKTTNLHTAAHLMLAAMRQVLGDHIFQRGSNITAERLRFDFSHGEKLTDDQIKKIEDLVNEQISKKLPVKMQEMTLEEAKRAGAMGIFENKYGNRVKVYTVDDFSKEICGGPHAKNTGDLGQFKIIKQQSSSAGVRRVKAVLE